MSTELELFKDNPLVSSSLFDELMEANKKLMGSGMSDRHRISIRGGRFRQIVGGEQTAVSKQDSMNIVILEGGAVARTYYEGAFDPNNPTPPTCWSPDAEKPDPSVPEKQRQAADCRTCKQNIKGSGTGQTRACRFSQRCAVVIEGDWETVYQLQLPATSIFGKQDGDKMPLQAYVRHLAAHRAPVQGIITKMYFDENSESPKLFFKPARPLKNEELEAVLELRKTDAVQDAITFTVYQTDTDKDFEVEDEEPEEKPKRRRSAKKSEPEPDPEPTPGFFSDNAGEGDVEEPKKAASKAKKEPPKEKEDLNNLIDVWDD